MQTKWAVLTTTISLGVWIMNFLDFFKKIGKVFQNIFTIVQKVVPESLLLKGIDLVEQAAEKFAENALRRNWVLTELQLIPGVNESIARLVVELAVQHVKADAIALAAEKAKDAIDPDHSSH